MLLLCNNKWPRIILIIDTMAPPATVWILIVLQSGKLRSNFIHLFVQIVSDRKLHLALFLCGWHFDTHLSLSLSSIFPAVNPISNRQSSLNLFSESEFRHQNFFGGQMAHNQRKHYFWDCLNFYQFVVDFIFKSLTFMVMARGGYRG